jgi:hypothetical protein
MSYDFYLFKPGAHSNARDEYKAITDTESDPGPIDPNAERHKKEIAAALVQLCPALEPFVFEYDKVAEALGCSEPEARRRFRHIELTHREHPWQVTVHDRYLFVTLPFGDSGDAARVVFDEVAGCCSLVSERWGFQTYDPQLDKVIDWQTNGDEPLACYEATMRAAAPAILAAVKAAAKSAKAAKPWWKFW